MRLCPQIQCKAVRRALCGVALKESFPEAYSGIEHRSAEMFCSCNNDTPKNDVSKWHFIPFHLLFCPFVLRYAEGESPVLEVNCLMK